MYGSVYIGLHEFNPVYRKPLTFFKEYVRRFSPTPRLGKLWHVISSVKCSKAENLRRLQKVQGKLVELENHVEMGLLL